ncbi:MAG: hypothetical protein M3463_09240 [Verrucomicrobiota bacterium]|nr:hypothetical protein [Verrucomicrobiota bacterium]
MKAWNLVLRGARYYWRTHLGVILGAALGTMILTGALLVGDSVKATLTRQALLRVGNANAALVSGDRFFRDRLAPEIGHGAAPVLFVRGSVTRVDGEGRINQAQVLGVDDAFWALAPEPGPGLTGDQLGISERVAAQLHVKEGDTLVIRVEKPGAFSRDAPLSGEENEVVAIRTTVARVVADEAFGRFGLSASQVPPFNVFLRIGALQERLQFPGRANLLLVNSMTASDLALAVRQRWTLEDANLEIRELKTGGLELRTPRVFLEPSIRNAAPRGVEALTYLVNELRAGEKAAPYSMVTAVDAAARVPPRGARERRDRDHSMAGRRSRDRITRSTQAHLLRHGRAAAIGGARARVRGVCHRADERVAPRQLLDAGFSWIVRRAELPRLAARV